MSKPIQRSFAAGEIAEELFARVDLAKRQTGLALCKNFWVLPHGPVQNCPGSKYVLDVKDSTNKVRLRGFAFSDTQTMVLEFGAGWIRFHTAGGTVLEATTAITGITQANPGVVTDVAHGYSNGQTVFLAGIGGMTQLNGRFVKVAGVAANTYQLQDLNGANINTTGYGAYTAGGTAARVYEIATTYAAADIFDLHFTQKADVMTIVHPGYAPAELKRLGATNWTLTNINFALPTVANVNALVTYAAAGADNNNLGAAGANLYEYLITFTMTGTQEESIGYRPRRWVSKGNVLAVNGATNANPGVFQTTVAHGLAVNDPVIVSGIGGVSGRFATYIGAINSVPDATHFTLKDLVTNTPVDTSAFSPFGSNGSVQRLGNAISAATNANPGVFTTSDANHFLVVGDPVIVEGVQGMGGNLASYTGVVASTPSITTFTLNNVDGTTLDTTAFGAYTGGGVIRVLGAKTDLTVAGNSVNVKLIAAPLPTGAIRFNVYKKLNGLFGFVGQASMDGKFVDANIAPDMSRTPGILPPVVFAQANDYPGAIGYYEGRRAFGGTNNGPLLLTASRSGTESNITYSIPSRDDDAIILSILSSEAARIRHIVPLDVLVLLTALGVWKVAPVNSDILTPSSAKPKLMSGGGASNVQPVLSGAAVLFPAAQGGRIRELKYKADANFIAAYQTTDISVMAPHLFDGFTIVDAAYSESPNRMAFFVRSDGVLIGLTYLPEHDVAAWWQRTTDGLFESVAAVLEGNETVLYCIVNHQGVRKVEIFSTRRFATLADSFFVDSGVTYSGAPITTISNGLWHLENKTVSILADGAVHAQKVVTNGSITLDLPASKVQIGLPIVADLQTLPVAVEGAPAFGMANLKNINRAWLRVKDTSSIKVGPDFNTLRTPKQRTNEPMGAPPALKSGIIDVTLDGKWVDDAPICLRQDQPLPVTITSIALGIADGG